MTTELGLGNRRNRVAGRLPYTFFYRYNRQKLPFSTILTIFLSLVSVSRDSQETSAPASRYFLGLQHSKPTLGTLQKNFLKY